jgi:hypothetical protein
MDVAAKAMGRGDEWQRLGGSLVVDPGKLLDIGWKPAIDTRTGLAALTRAVAISSDLAPQAR